MATTLDVPLSPSETNQPRRMTIAEYDRIPEGVFDERVELIEGLIYTKMGQNLPHITAVRLMMAALRAVFVEGFDVSGQLPIGLGEISKPEPDVLVLRGAPEDYDGRYPNPEREVVVLVEVSDSYLERDTEIKARLYATYGVPEYWIVNLRDRVLEVRRRPTPERGVYAETVLFREGETLLIGSGTVSVDRILPKAN